MTVECQESPTRFHVFAWDEDGNGFCVFCSKRTKVGDLIEAPATRLKLMDTLTGEQWQRLGELMRTLGLYREWHQYAKCAKCIEEDFGVKVNSIYGGRHPAYLRVDYKGETSHPSMASEKSQWYYIRQFGEFDLMSQWTPETKCPDLPSEILEYLK